MARFVLNEISYFGSGCRTEIKGEMTSRGLKKAFVCTDSDLLKFGVAKMVLDQLDSANVDYVTFSDIRANPTTQTVKDAVEAFKKSNADFIIAIGGGSVIDTAKAVGIIIKNPEFADVLSLEGVAPTKNRAVLTFAFPTTAGTAAEVTINYVITDEVNHRKMVCVDPKDIPQVAFVDAELMFSMPKGLTAATGMDALTHAIEGFITPGATAMSDMFELQAIKLIASNLKDAVDNGSNKEARENMALGQYIAGMGFSNVGLGIVHSMAHTLGAIFDSPHGVANAIILPTVMEYNIDSPAKPKFRQIAEAMGVEVSKMNDDEAAIAAVKSVKDLSLSINIPTKVSDVGVREEHLDKLSVDAFGDVCTGGNPRATSVEDIKKLFKSML